MRAKKQWKFLCYPVFILSLMFGFTILIHGEDSGSGQTIDESPPIVVAENTSEANPIEVDAEFHTTRPEEEQTVADAAQQEDTYREQYHFSNEQGWSNDPNGMVYYKGTWHMYFQYYPDGVNHGAMSWGHASSTDLVHWTKHEVPNAFKADIDTATNKGKVHWSGCAVWDKNNTSGFFNGQPDGGLVAIWTEAALPSSMEYDGNGSQRQAIAYSLDGFQWTIPDLGIERVYQDNGQPGSPIRELTSEEKEYFKNVVLADFNILRKTSDSYISDDPLHNNDFRDPKVFWHETSSQWMMVVAGGPLRIYSSPDLKNWKPEAMQPDIVTECPELYYLPIKGSSTYKYVLSEGGRWYQIGDFKQVDGVWTFVADPDSRFEMNYAPDAYAAQSFFAPDDDRVIMVQWMSNWSYADDTTVDAVQMPGLRKVLGETHNGQFTLYSELYLVNTPEGLRMAQKPVKEYDSLENAAFNYTNATIDPSKTNIFDGFRSRTFRLDMVITPGASTQEVILEVLKNAKYETTIRYNVAAQTLTLDRSHSMDRALAPTDHEQNGTWFSFLDAYTAPVALRNGMLSLHIFVDDYSIEVYADDYTKVLTALVFPEADAVNMNLYTIGGTASADIHFATMDSTRKENINMRALTHNMQTLYNTDPDNPLYKLAKSLVFSDIATQKFVNAMNVWILIENYRLNLSNPSVYHQNHPFIFCKRCGKPGTCFRRFRLQRGLNGHSGSFTAWNLFQENQYVRYKKTRQSSTFSFYPFAARR